MSNGKKNRPAEACDLNCEANSQLPQAINKAIKRRFLLKIRTDIYWSFNDTGNVGDYTVSKDRLIDE